MCFMSLTLIDESADVYITLLLDMRMNEPSRHILGYNTAATMAKCFRATQSLSMRIDQAFMSH